MSFTIKAEVNYFVIPHLLVSNSHYNMTAFGGYDVNLIVDVDHVRGSYQGIISETKRSTLTRLLNDVLHLAFEASTKKDSNDISPNLNTFARINKFFNQETIEASKDAVNVGTWEFKGENISDYVTFKSNLTVSELPKINNKISSGTSACTGRIMPPVEKTLKAFDVMLDLLTNCDLDFVLKDSKLYTCPFKALSDEIKEQEKIERELAEMKTEEPKDPKGLNGIFINGINKIIH